MTVWHRWYTFPQFEICLRNVYV